MGRALASAPHPLGWRHLFIFLIARAGPFGTTPMAKEVSIRWFALLGPLEAPLR